MTDQTTSTKMSNALIKFIDEWKDKPGNLIMVLHRVQEEYGYIPRDIAFELSERINVPMAKIYGVITFYHFFKLEKPGEHIISVCMGTACYLKGGGDILNELQKMLGVNVQEVTEDGKFSIEPVRCIGCCGLAPVITVDGTVYGRVEVSDLAEIVAKYQNE